MLAPHDDQSCGLKFTLRYVPSYLVIEASDHGSALSALVSQSETFRLITSLRLASQSTFYRHWLGGTSLNGESQVEPSDFELLIEPEELDVGDIVAADFELMERLATRGSASATAETLLAKFHPDDLSRAKALISEACRLDEIMQMPEAERAELYWKIVLETLLSFKYNRELAEVINALLHLEELDMRHTSLSLTPGLNRHHPSLKYIAMSNISPFCNLSELNGLPAGLRQIVLDNPTREYSHCLKAGPRTIEQAAHLARGWSMFITNCRIRGHMFRDDLPAEERDEPPRYMPICGEGTWWPREEENELPSHRVFSDTV